MLRTLLGLFLVLAASCDRSVVAANGPGEPRRTSPAESIGATVSPVIVRPEELATALGKTVTIRGVARDAKLCAVLLVGDAVVYCLGVDAWPANLEGKEVTASGTLESTDQFVARPGPGGEINQGTDGNVLVLRDCRHDGG